MTHILGRVAWIYSVIFLSAGISGFIPALSEGNLALGIFEVNALHNWVHIITGLAAGVVAATSEHAAKRFFQIFGLLYGFIAVIGLIQIDTVLGLMPLNVADHLLHIFASGIALVLGYGVEESVTRRHGHA